MRLLGEYIGLCFQIKDDIFDYFSDNGEIGKPTGNDMHEGKLTLPLLFALNSTGDAEAAALAIKVKNGEAADDEIALLVDFAKRNGGIQYAERMMSEFRCEALNQIYDLPDDEVKQALTAYLDYVIERTK